MRRKAFLTLAIAFVLSATGTTYGQTTEFTYQGRLMSGGLPANGSHDFQFRLFGDQTGDAQIGPSLSMNAVNVNNGMFSVQLDFGNQFPGASRFIEIRVKQSTEQFFTVLTPRQAISSAPYAITSLNAQNSTNAETATNAVQLNGVVGSQYVLTDDARLSNERSPLPSSTNYIQNTSTPQPLSNFNISGNGTIGGTASADTINAITQFNIAGQRVLVESGNRGGGTLAVGIQSGGALTDAANSFFGNGSGAYNQGSGNSYFGFAAGFASAFGRNNSFFGTQSGTSIDTGDNNSFFGNRTGLLDRHGTHNTLIGSEADVETSSLSFATAIGSLAGVSQSNSLVLGAIAGRRGATADTNVGIGTTAPSERLHIHVNNGNILFGGGGCSSGFTGIGFGTTLSGCTNYSLLGNGTDTMINRPSGGSIYFRSGNSTQVTINPSGILAINTLGTGGATALCRNASNQISTCSSALRYKSNLHPFTSGLSFVRRLRPVSFTWKDGGIRDLGLVAEEVNRIDPLLTTTNAAGEVEGVKYDRLGIVLVNAIKEQQSQIEAQQRQIQRQQQQIQSLKQLVCRSTRARCRAR